MLLHTHLPRNICISVTDEESKLCALNFLKVKSLQLLGGFEISTINGRDFYTFVVVIVLPPAFPHSHVFSANVSPVDIKVA